MRILLVEDEPDLGAAIKRVLNQEKYVVDWVLDGTEAWEYLENYSLGFQPQTQYTLAILDWLLPGVSGIELCKRLRATGNPLPVLILTAKDRMEDKVTGLDAGADDYLVKPFGMAELLIPLTTKEFQLLEYFMHHPHQIVTRDQIRNQLWEVSSEPISNVVAAQMRLLRRKLSQIGGDRLIETVHGIGYRLNPTDASK